MGKEQSLAIKNIHWEIISFYNYFLLYLIGMSSHNAFILIIIIIHYTQSIMNNG